MAVGFFRGRVTEEVEHAVLQSCVELFAGEIVTKGLAAMIRARDFDALSRLYHYYADVAQLPELCRGLVDFINVDAGLSPHA